mmetsp:Transcript_68723/g.183100  ORF Transcript_68723/g.183100 Transcript_68723/m.183100 type:complete len:210 (-) Transcript_68723:251-880(-)
MAFAKSRPGQSNSLGTLHSPSARKAGSSACCTRASAHSTFAHSRVENSSGLPRTQSPTQATSCWAPGPAPAWGLPADATDDTRAGAAGPKAAAAPGGPGSSARAAATAQTKLERFWEENLLAARRRPAASAATATLGQNPGNSKESVPTAQAAMLTSCGFNCARHTTSHAKAVTLLSAARKVACAHNTVAATRPVSFGKSRHNSRCRTE